MAKFNHKCDARCYGDETANTIPEQRRVEIENDGEFQQMVEAQQAGELTIYSLARGKNGVLWIATISERRAKPEQQTLL